MRRIIKRTSIFVTVVILIILVRLFVCEVCIVSTESMEPAIRPTEILVLDKLSYGCCMPRRWADIPLINIFTWIPSLRQKDNRRNWGFHRGWGLRKPQEGDVAVFYSPEEPDMLLVKRIKRIIEPGTKLAIDSMRDLVEKMAVQEHVSIVKRLNKTYIGGKPTNLYTTKTTFYDMRGDNTGNSYDSRRFGPIPEQAIAGRMGFVLWSWDDRATGWNKVRWDRLFRPVR